jgi:hypothetical protein
MSRAVLTQEALDAADCGPFRIGTANRQTMAPSGGGHPGQTGTVYRLGQAAHRIRGEQLAAEIEIRENKQLNCLVRRKATDNSFQAGQVFENRRFTALLARTPGEFPSLARGEWHAERPGCDIANSRRNWHA